MATPSHSSVIIAWIIDEPLKSKNLVSDSQNLTSYDTIIGYTDTHTGKKVLIKYLGDETISPSTSRHVTHVLRIRDKGGKAIIRGMNFEFGPSRLSYETVHVRHPTADEYKSNREKYTKHIEEHGVMQNFVYIK